MPEYGIQREEVETWKNVSDARHVIKKFGAKGDLIDEMVNGRRTFHVTTRERHLNMERAANADLDPFTNGNLSPVTLLDSTEDADEIANNPNLMSEDDMTTLVRGNVKTLQKRVGEVKNPALLERLHEIAVSEDCTIGKLTAIASRMNEVNPALYTETTAAPDGRR